MLSYAQLYSCWLTSTKAKSRRLPEATSDIRVLIQRAIRVLKRIYQPEYGHHKAGAMSLDLIPAVNRQFAVFDAKGAASNVRLAGGRTRRDQSARWAGSAETGD
jgi:hypothetical protein